MDPILRAIRYFFEKNNKTLEDVTIKSFIKNYIKLPEFVALAYKIKVKDIPGFKPHPKTSVDKYTNKGFALQYILDNNDNINKIGPNIETDSIYPILLSCVLVDQCFPINISQVLFKCNKILESKDLKIEENDLFNVKCILKLLKALTKIEIPEDIELNEFNQTFAEICKKVKIPQIIDDSCFEIERKFLFLIQIQIILETFYDSDENNSEYSDHTVDFSYFLNTKKEKKRKLILYISPSISVSNISETDIYINSQQENNDQCTVDTIKAILENKKFNIRSLESSIEDIIHILQKLFINDEYEQKILKRINDIPVKSNKSKLELIINHLETKNPKFKSLILNFEDQKYVESSILMLFTNILDSFFLKKSKEELYHRCYTLLYGKYQECPPYEDAQRTLYDWNTYVALINFINDDRAKIKLESSKLFGKNKLKNDKKQIPVVISENYLKTCPSNYIPNVVYYQLQFIFDALDKSDFQHRLVEYFIITIRKFSQIEIPATDTLASSIRAKNISLILQNKQYKKNLHKSKTESHFQLQANNQTLESNPTIESIQARSELENKKMNTEKSIEINSDIDDQLQKQDKKLFFDDGILYEIDFEDGSQTFKNLIESINHKEDININDNHNNDIIIQYKNIQNVNTFILFIYDNANNAWRFNKSALEMNIFQSKKNIYKKNQLVLFLESYLTQSHRILSIKKDLNENCICIYGSFDGNNVISLFLHVPESLQNLPNLKDIVFQIYFFLSFISDLNIVILDEVKCIEQIKIIRKIINLKNSFSKETNKTFDQIKDESIKNKLINKFNKVSSSLLEKQTRFLILINDVTHMPKITNDIKEVEFLNEITGKICFMNIYDTDSNNNFNDLIQQITIELNYKNVNLYKAFSLIDFFHMDHNYINWVFNDLNEDILIKLITNDMMDELIINDNSCIFNPKFNSTNLRNSIYSTFPILDSTYLNKWNELIELKEKFYLDTHQNLINKFKKISKDCIKNITQCVKNKLYWSNEEIENIKAIEKIRFHFVERIYPSPATAVPLRCILNSQLFK